ncbi:ATP-dependent RNA helicase RhlE [Pseudooceanicola marinus]|uniref:DEAD-box ATP-dependent RNA helicase RhpA n=1 Tax=Pseudooceanicola marinus TaxID=396013 RepID=A0A1X6ZDX3_9RHOB|nr:DEAD/DEAH box helicase [Pseudooceanicola marinus]PJE28399.1 ATP-dependent helicase [Pseudooceanicola marinus]SLN49067.1 ATP-dependent RNA helicase RhlE [Pseudooceanicola marinus]
MTKFSDLDLDPKVLKAIADAGYETPTPIQAGAIPHALKGKDVLGIAQTGTGKTASFTLPMITRLAKGRARARMPRSLVLCPTRELAAQVAENFDQYTKYMKLTKALLIGGVSFKEQDALIDRGVDVLIATPGRLLDHFERGKLLLTGVEVMVVDEADRMLDMGFIPDIERIFSLTPFTRQTMFYSATMAPEIERITNTFLSAPERIEVARQATTGENIEQSVVMYKPSRKDREGSEKRRILRQLIDMEGEALTNAIVFCNRKTDVDVTAKSLKKYGYDAAPIHGDLDQSHRTKTLDGFRDGSLKILVASDVAARGLDVPSVSHVFNFDVPSHSEDYVHRIGRTGRAGRKGKAVMICVPRDEKNLADIEKLVEREIPRLELPGVKSAPKAEAPETAGEEAKDAKPEGKPSRSRTRSRSRKPNEEQTPTPEAVTEAAAEAPKAEDKAPAAPAKAEAAEQPRNEPKAERNDRQDNRGGGSDRSRGSSSRGGKGRGNDKAVVGMGDHLPSFIALSFDERRAS